MRDDINIGTLKPLFTIYVDDDGQHYAVRSLSPKFCLSAKSAWEAAERGNDALASYTRMRAQQP